MQVLASNKTNAMFFAFILVMLVSTARHVFSEDAQAGEVKKIGPIEFVYIPAGSFMMGSNKGFAREKPVHRVELDGFWISKYEITQSQFEGIMGFNPSCKKKNKQNHPVTCINWIKSMEFCRTFGKKFKVEARLPYEAEWEYACRAGTTTEFYWGDNLNPAYINLNDETLTTYPVGSKKPNAFGLFDMSGNVYEWCMDWCDETYYSKSPVKNPKGPKKGDKRVVRGGSSGNESLSYSACRICQDDDNSYDNTGIRIVIEAK